MKQITRKYILYLDESIINPIDTRGCMRPDDKINFGKHKGKKLKEVMKDDPSYVKWAIEEKIIKIL